MGKQKSQIRGLVFASTVTITLGSALALAANQSVDWRGEGHTKKLSATYSSPIAITGDDDYVWSVNPDNDSVSVFRVSHDANEKVAEVRVGKEPWCVAIKSEDDDHHRHHDRNKHRDDDDAKVYVTNMVSGTVSVIDPEKKRVIKTIKVGAEPFGCVLSPDGRKLYVSNQSSNTVSVIDTRWDHVVKTIGHVGPKPHGIAVTADGEKVYVTQLLSERPARNEARPLTQTEGADDGRVGRVTVIDAHAHKVIKKIVLFYPMAIRSLVNRRRRCSTIRRAPSRTCSRQS